MIGEHLFCFHPSSRKSRTDINDINPFEKCGLWQHSKTITCFDRQRFQNEIQKPILECDFLPLDFEENHSKSRHLELFVITPHLPRRVNEKGKKRFNPSVRAKFAGEVYFWTRFTEEHNGKQTRSDCNYYFYSYNRFIRMYSVFSFENSASYRRLKVER